MNYRNIAVLESFMHFHPDIYIKIYASYNLSDVIEVERYKERGYNLKIIQLDDSIFDHFSSSCPNGNWLKRKDITTYKFFYSHLTDYLRFCILYLYGGIYADFDALLINRIPNSYLEYSGLISGLDMVPDNENCKWCFGSDKNYYAAPGFMLAGKPHLKVFEMALLIGFSNDHYNPHIFNSAGPLPFNLAIQSEKDKTQIMLLERHLFYPKNYQEIRDSFKKESFNISEYHQISKSSISFHFFGGTTSKFLIENGSLLSKLFPIPILWKLPIFYMNNFIDFFSVKNLIKDIILRFEGVKSFEVFDGHLSYKFFGNQKSVNESIIKIKVINNSTPFCIQSLNIKLCIPKVNINNLITIIMKPFGRLNNVISLVQSIRNIYPNINILIGNDGLQYQLNKLPHSRIQIHNFPFDIGLSSGRNLLIEKFLETDFFFLIDEDFVFDEDISDLPQLLFNFLRNNLDILAANCINEEYDYIGKYFVSRKGTERKVWMIPVHRDIFSEIQVVDFVPNVFLARKSLIEKIKWRNSLKLGEHEDFFLLAKKLNIQIGSSNLGGFYHNQVDYSNFDFFYKRMRSRVFKFLERSLEFNNLTEIKFFGKSLIRKNTLSSKSNIIFVELNFNSSSIRLDFYPYSQISGYEINFSNSSCYHYIPMFKSRKYKNIYKFSENINCKYFESFIIDSLNHTDKSAIPLKIDLDLDYENDFKTNHFHKSM
jgi:hypothetical protein